jgi:hypothetical protein
MEEFHPSRSFALTSRLPAGRETSKLPPSMKVPLPALSVALFAGAASLTHCSGGDDNGPSPPPPCVENLNVDCIKLLYEPPTYSNIFTQSIQQKCSLGSSCHSADGAMGGLVLVNADDTYEALLGLKGGVKRVLPRDPKCSPLMVRLASRDPNYVMPRGAPFAAEELCDFVHWIKQGAEKN